MVCVVEFKTKLIFIDADFHTVTTRADVITALVKIARSLFVIRFRRLNSASYEDCFLPLFLLLHHVVNKREFSSRLNVSFDRRENFFNLSLAN